MNFPWVSVPAADGPCSEEDCNPRPGAQVQAPATSSLSPASAQPLWAAPPPFPEQGAPKAWALARARAKETRRALGDFFSVRLSLVGTSLAKHKENLIFQTIGAPRKGQGMVPLYGNIADGGGAWGLSVRDSEIEVDGSAERGVQERSFWLCFGERKGLSGGQF